MTLMVGVSGVRGLIGETLTPELAMQFAQSYGTVLGGERVVLARDSRPSGEMYAAAAAAGLLSVGCRVTQLGIAMTPTVGRTVQEGGYAGGMSITASHNPTAWNGLKFFDPSGSAASAELAARIASTRQVGKFRLAKSGFEPVRLDPDAGQRHVRAVLDAMTAKPPAGLPVVLDSINGAGCLHTPGFLRSLGCRLTHINAEPTGVFAHPPEPIQENLAQLCDAVRNSGAAVGFAQDPDADRLAIVDEHGVYIGEEYTLALSAEAALSQRPGPIAANLSTSRMIDDIARRHGCSVLRTPVGEAHVARAVSSGNCTLGGEGNGGVIDPRICLVRDGLSAMSLVLQLISTTGKTVSQLVATLPRYAFVKQKLECPRERIDAAVAAVTSAFADRRPNTSDGVRVDFPEGWVHLRASNTEPIMRVFAEAAEPKAAEQLISTVRRAAGL